MTITWHDFFLLLAGLVLGGMIGNIALYLVFRALHAYNQRHR